MGGISNYNALVYCKKILKSLSIYIPITLTDWQAWKLLDRSSIFN